MARNELAVQWDSYDPVPATRATRKENARVEQESLRRRKRHEAAYDDAKFRTVAENELQRLQALLRSRGSQDVLDYTASRTAQRLEAYAQRSRAYPQLGHLVDVLNGAGVDIGLSIAHETFGAG